MGYEAKILRDSIGPNGIRLLTYEVTFPRLILAEVNTHRNFSRNSASSRAIPIEKMLAKALEDTFLPVYWGKNQRGMAAKEELSADKQIEAIRIWTEARDNAIASVKQLQALDVHKQISNRLLEPFLYHTALITSTEWLNWDNLRDHQEAQPEIKKLASMMKAVRAESKPKLLSPGEWHLPLVDDYDHLLAEGFTQEQIVWICVGRCARVSYLTHDGKRDPQADIDLATRLLSNGHMSPFEHAAMCLTEHETQWYGNIRGWLQSRKQIPNEAVYQLPSE